MNRGSSGLLLLLLLMLVPALGQAAGNEAITAFTIAAEADGSQKVSVTMQILFVMTALTLLPAILMMMTAFTRIIVVLAILRQALGMQSTPNNQILLGLALFMTFFVMAPVFNVVNETALQPYLEEKIAPMEALERAKKPIREFMLAQTRKSDLEAFIKIADIGPIATPEDTPFTVMVPAFVTSELKTAFQIGFLLFIPFLIIDLVVASVLMAMGMMMLSPLIISLPFKLMLFVLVDGWVLVMGSLASSFIM